MGAWGYKTFEDDTACDWAYELEGADDPVEFLDKSLTVENAEDGFVEYDKCCEILAASEVIYALKFGPRDGFCEDLLNWLEENKEINVSKLALKSAKSLTVVTSEESELNQLWRENEEMYPQWLDNVNSLIKGLNALA